MHKTCILLSLLATCLANDFVNKWTNGDDCDQLARAGHCSMPEFKHLRRWMLTNCRKSCNDVAQTTNNPITPPSPTKDPTPPIPTEDPTPPIPTENPTPPIPTENPTPPIPTEDPTTPIPTEDPTPPIPTEEPTPPVPTEDPIPPFPTEDPTPPIPQSTIAPCENKRQHNAACRMLIKDCTSTLSFVRKWMRENCKRTCRLCGTVQTTMAPTPPSPPVPQSTIVSCGNRQVNTICNKLVKDCNSAFSIAKTWMRENCKRTCGLCGQKQTTVAPPTPPIPKPTQGGVVKAAGRTGQISLSETQSRTGSYGQWATILHMPIPCDGEIIRWYFQRRYRLQNSYAYLDAWRKEGIKKYRLIGSNLIQRAFKLGLNLVYIAPSSRIKVRRGDVLGIHTSRMAGIQPISNALKGSGLVEAYNFGAFHEQLKSKVGQVVSLTQYAGGRLKRTYAIRAVVQCTASGCPMDIRTFTNNTLLCTRDRGMGRGTWMRDSSPTAFNSNKVYLIEGQTHITKMYMYTSEDNMCKNVTSKIFNFPGLIIQGTDQVVYDDALYGVVRGYYRQLVRYDLGTGMKKIVNFPHGRCPYAWGGFSYVDFAADELGLWAIYGSDAKGVRPGRDSCSMKLSKLDPISLKVEKTWSLGWTKTRLGNAFMACGKLYVIGATYGDPVHVEYTFDTTTGKKRELDQSSQLPLGKHRGLISMSYNRNDRKIYARDFYLGLKQYSLDLETLTLPPPKY